MCAEERIYSFSWGTSLDIPDIMLSLREFFRFENIFSFLSDCNTPVFVPYLNMCNRFARLSSFSNSTEVTCAGRKQFFRNCVASVEYSTTSIFLPHDF